MVLEMLHTLGSILLTMCNISPLPNQRALIVREIHGEAIARFGGSDGVRDSALLEFAADWPRLLPIPSLEQISDPRCFVYRGMSRQGLECAQPVWRFWR